MKWLKNLINVYYIPTVISRMLVIEIFKCFGIKIVLMEIPSSSNVNISIFIRTFELSIVLCIWNKYRIGEE